CRLRAVVATVDLFFFQAEDGIRDFHVTGVQTCALPIFNVILMFEGEEEFGSPSLPAFIEANRDRLACDVAFNSDSDMWSPTRPRSEERRVGKECRERGGPEQ